MALRCSLSVCKSGGSGVGVSPTDGTIWTPQEKTTLERQIAALDSEVDALVYELCGLTDADIKFVEGSRR